MERRAASLSVMLRRPKAMVMQWKLLSSNGRHSPLTWATWVLWPQPASISRSRPTASMASLMSASTTWPLSPTRRENLIARSPVPPARSSTFWPGRTPASSRVMRLSTRWLPMEIRSFMTSYLAATDRNTPATRCCFSCQGTC